MISSGTHQTLDFLACERVDGKKGVEHEEEDVTKEVERGHGDVESPHHIPGEVKEDGKVQHIVGGLKKDVW